METQSIWHNGALLEDDEKTLGQLQIANGEMLSVHVREANRPAATNLSRQQISARARDSQDRETQRLTILGNPTLRRQIEEARPELAAVLDNPARFAAKCQELQDQEQMEMDRRRQAIQNLNNDPFDIDAQMRIQEMIREERVQENLQNAIEHMPEGNLLACL